MPVGLSLNTTLKILRKLPMWMGKCSHFFRISDVMLMFLCCRHASRTRAARSCDHVEVSDWTGLFGNLSSLVFYFPLSFSLSWCGLVLLSRSSHSEYTRGPIRWYTITGSEGADFPWCTTLTLPSVFMLCENLIFFLTVPQGLAQAQNGSR